MEKVLGFTKSALKAALGGLIIVGITVGVTYLLGVHNSKRISSILSYVGCATLLLSGAGFFGQSDSYRDSIRISRHGISKPLRLRNEGYTAALNPMNLIIVTVVIFAFSVILF